MTKHVVVLMGGLSAEREVSLSSGESVVKALKNLGYKVNVIDPDRNFFNELEKFKPDVVFNALHGTYGEDGVIPGVLEMMNIPYTHSGVMSSAIALNKEMTKKILYHYGIKMPKGFTTSLTQLIEENKNNREPIPKPYVIKPLQQGSSLGVIIMNKNEEQSLEHKVNDMNWKYGDVVLIEEYIPGKELSTGVINGKAIGTLELKPKVGFFDYKAKYTDGMTDHIYPAKIPQDVYDQTLKFAEIAHAALNCRSVSRTDFRYDDTKPGKNNLYFLEINTHPGFTDLSIVPDIANKNGMKFEELIRMLIEDAICEIKP